MFKPVRVFARETPVMEAMRDNLVAVDRHPDLSDADDLYGRLIGSWRIGNRSFDEETGQWQTNALSWHFGRILDGLGVQDVLRGERGAGTTVRVYDRGGKLWRVGWYGPVRGNFATLTGAAGVDGIDQEGVGTDGRPIRWNFRDLSPHSFRWEGWISDDGGLSWRLEQEMDATRDS
jgi:hypothetical protein